MPLSFKGRDFELFFVRSITYNQDTGKYSSNLLGAEGVIPRTKIDVVVPDNLKEVFFAHLSNQYPILVSPPSSLPSKSTLVVYSVVDVPGIEKSTVNNE